MTAQARKDNKQPSLIAIDWGTSRFRGYLTNSEAEILDEVSSEDGMATVRDGAFSRILLARCGDWLDRHPRIPLLMAGMVGSRNGWKEAPYVACPASAAELREAMQPIEIKDGHFGAIVPGLIHRQGEVSDVIRGEETKIFGTRIENGWIVMPGTHSKWAFMDKGKVSGFRSYMTGEFYGLLRQHSVLRLLAKAPDDRGGFMRGIEAARREGGLLHQAFEARTAVLDSRMRGEEVGPFISGLLIAHEIGSATGTLVGKAKVTVIADGELAQNYSEALGCFDFSANILSPRHCFVRGMLRLAADG